MTTVPKWAPYVLLVIFGHCLIKLADGSGLLYWIYYCIWCLSAAATVSAVVDHMRIRHAAAIWKGIPR